MCCEAGECIACIASRVLNQGSQHRKSEKNWTLPVFSQSITSASSGHVSRTLRTMLSKACLWSRLLVCELGESAELGGEGWAGCSPYAVGRIYVSDGGQAFRLSIILQKLLTSRWSQIKKRILVHVYCVLYLGSMVMGKPSDFGQVQELLFNSWFQ